MARQFGLRTEIIVNLCILMGAALLFSGFLLLNLLERELIRTHVQSARQHLVLAARLAGNTPDARSEVIRRVLSGSFTQWLLVDADLRPVDADSPDSSWSRSDDLNWSRFEEEPIAYLDYSSFYLPGRKDIEAVIITVPLRTGGRFAGALQGCFPLAPVREALAGATQIFLAFVFLYGGVLLLFGFWLLGKAVVRPVRQLTEATARIAGGDLQPVTVSAGPLEIANLAESFNRMTSALQDSRTKTDLYIDSLRQANEELRQTRNELVRSERLASVGHLAAGMAHEIGNPLGAITGYLHLLRSELPPGREREIAMCAGTEADRIDRLVRDLLDYARPDAAEAEPGDPLAVLTEAIELLKHQGALADIVVENRMTAALPKVAITRHKLLQVFVNLLLNARDAIRLSVERGGGEKSGTLRLEAGANDCEVWVAIGDNGGGIEPAVLPHIFDPFFTTKPIGHGRGLGLTVCHRIVTDAGGRIDVQSSNEGTAFKVRVPILVRTAA